MTGDWTGRIALAALLVLAFTESVGASPGDGIRVGGTSGRLHPYLELEGRYDTNVAYDDQAQATAGFILHVRPGLTFDSPGERAAVSLKAHLDWAQYLGQNSDLSRLYGESQLGLGLNRRGAVGLEVTDTFRRSASTTAFNLGSAVVSNSNQLQVSLPFRPGGGAFVTTLSGGWDLETFQAFQTSRLCDPALNPVCDTGQLDKLSYSDVSGRLELRWKFLPRTAAVAQAEYWKRLPASTNLGADASGWRASAGLAGLFTAHLAGTVRGGWAAVSNTPGSTSSWYANLEAEWLPLETATLKLGYVHDVSADPGRDASFSSHRVYATGAAQMAGRYGGQLDASYEHRGYTSGSTSADQFQVSPVATLELARWLQVGAGLAYTKRSTDLPAASPRLPGYNYDKTEAFVRVRGTY